MYKNYLITGGTGFLGRELVKRLVQAGGNVKALVLENDPLKDLLPSGVETVTGDVCDISSLEAFFDGADENTCVIHCAGIVSIASRPDDRIYRVNMTGTANILQQCIERQPGRLIYVSSVHAIPEKAANRFIEENAVFSPELVCGHYARSKAMATSLVLGAAARGLDACVVFPSGIIGPGDYGHGSITGMLLSFLRGRMPFAVKGGYDFVDVRDVADGIILCACRGRPGGKYLLTGHRADIRDILDLANEAAGTRHRPLYLPLFLAAVAAPICEWVCRRKRMPMIFTPCSIAVLSSGSRFSYENSARELGYSPRPLRTSIRDMVLWLKENVLH